VWILVGVYIFLSLIAFLVCQESDPLEVFWLLYFFGFLVEITLGFPVFFHVQYSCCSSVGFVNVLVYFSWLVPESSETLVVDWQLGWVKCPLLVLFFWSPGFGI
jgi:hypothetical protein